MVRPGSMTNSDLVPEVHVNKNGVPVTKHVRPAKTTTRRSFPALSITGGPDNEAWSPLGYFLGQRLKLSGLTNPERAKMRKTLHPDTLQRCAMLGSDRTDMLLRTVNSCIRDKSMVTLNNVAVFGDMCDDEHATDFDHYIAGLNRYVEWDNHKPVDYSTASDDERAAAHALLEVTYALEGNPGYLYVNENLHASVPHTRIISPLLAKLVMQRPKDAQRIIALLKERDLMVDIPEDIDDLEEILDNGYNGALRDGAL